ncbi:uncharacterized protein LOC112637651 [Camponotus floridanus]|nr:uncharacterized protein LOC112637651 [Camponotus floridanus]XP_025263582.1 uncharacterized protein LOC112637651 [Camponotus floridanus]XP_025263583.1 uncharacterized protein LOC112637651 [Camponotus floridanus]
MEFTKPEDPEQRIADPWIKKMQEISRQKREKWVPYKRNENEKLTLDNVEETTRANKLRDDESITPFDPILTLAQSSMDQDSASVNNFHDSSLQSTDTRTDELSQRLDLWDVSAENTSADIDKKNPVMLHQRYKDYEISNIEEVLVDKQNAIATDYERSELEKDRSLTSKVNSQESKESNSQGSKSQHRSNDRKRYSNSDENLDYKNNSKKSLAKVNPRQSNLSQNDKEENSKNKKHNKEMAKPSMWKIKEERDDAEEKDTTGRSLNHGGSYHPGRWGMSLSQPPMEFRKDIFRSTHRKNKEHTESEKDRRHDLVERWDNAASPPKKLKNGNIMLHLTAHLGTKSPGQVKGSSYHRSLAHQNHQDSQTDDEHNKELAETSHEQIPKNCYHLLYPKVNYQNNHQTNVDLNHLSRNLKFLMQALQSLHEQNVDIPMSCCIQIPYVLFRT